MGAQVELFRLFGFAIEPQRLTDPSLFNDPLGGQLPIKATLRQALDRSLRDGEGSGRMTQVDLNGDLAPDGGRRSDVRDAVLGLAFERSATARTAALDLARRLSRAMDERSPDCLFLIAAYRERGKDERRVAVWIFPQDEAFRFSPGGQAASTDIELLTDIFSRTSGLRKMALFSGKDIKTHFLGARVLDFQTGRADDVAVFWIERFLDAKLSITPAAGTKVLADGLRRASEADLTLEEKHQVHAAAQAVYTMPKQNWSMVEIANDFLSGKAREVFLATAENEETRMSVFQLDRTALQKRLNVRNFRLPNGVFVSAPIEQVGEGKVVQVQDAADGEGEIEKLRVEADVIQDRLGSRRV